MSISSLLPRARLLARGALALIAGALTGCADDLTPSPPEAPAEPAPAEPASSEGGVRSLTLDATSQTDWVYLDLASGQTSSDDGTEWHLAFQRFHVRTNGGAFGPGAVALVRLDGVAFDAVSEAPAAGWLSDALDAEGELEAAIDALGAWYDYDVSTHVLTPQDAVWLVRDGDRAAFKLEFQGYYDAAGTPGRLALRWAAVTLPEGADPIAPGDPSVGRGGGEDPSPGEGGPTGPGGGAEEPAEPSWPAGTVAVDATQANQWVFIRVDTGVLDGEVAEDGLGWDLAVSRTRWRTNGGVSGPGRGGALALEQDFEAVQVAPTFGFTADELVSPPGPQTGELEPGNPVLSAWFDYDPQTHQVTPKPVTFVVRSAVGTYAKVSIVAYSSGAYGVRWAEVPGEPTVQTSEVDASSQQEWTYLRFDAGGVVEVDEPEASLGWDLALRRTLMRTNGGTSGPGQGGAISLGDVEILEVDVPVDVTLQEDAMVPLPGPPGSGEVSANPALDEWYDYDPVTHSVSPRAQAYLVRTALGDWAQLRVVEYGGGVYSLQWAYAGAGAATFMGRE